MTPDAKAAADTPLSIDGAAGLLGREPDDDQINSPAATTAEDGLSPEALAKEDVSSDASATADAETNATDDDTAGTPPLSPPRWWNKDAKERFTALPPELQAIVFQQEETRERVVQKAKQDAAAARQSAEGHNAQMAHRLAALDQLVPHAARMFQSRWANVDWSTLPDQVGADEAFKLKAQFEKERDTMFQLNAVQQAAEQEQFRHFVSSESEKLRAVAPDLADEKQGSERKRALGSFLLGLGFPADRIQYMSADEASIAYDAMRWRQAQSKAQTLARKQPAPAANPPVRPTAAAQRSTQTRSADDAFKRLKSSGRVDDAVALLNARG